MAMKFKLNKEQLREQDEENAGRWLVTYCSLAITLVAVFMMLVSYSTVAGGKMTQYRRGVGTAAKGPAGVAPEGTDPAESAIAVISAQAQLSGYSGKVEIARTKNGFKVIIPGNLMFAPESAKIQDEVLTVLEKMSDILKKGFFSLGIAGHTSDLPVNTAAFDSNWVLSGIRAAHVMQHIKKTGNIPEARLASTGYGQYRPVVSGSSADARERNERLEFLFVSHDTPLE
jgi:chemotaxis protein MotB